jgi:hypothetical protein
VDNTTDTVANKGVSFFLFKIVAKMSDKLVLPTFEFCSYIEGPKPYLRIFLQQQVHQVRFDSAAVLLGLHYDPEDGSNIFLPNVGVPPNCTALQPRRWYFSTR